MWGACERHISTWIVRQCTLHSDTAVERGGARRRPLRSVVLGVNCGSKRSMKP